MSTTSRALWIEIALVLAATALPATIQAGCLLAQPAADPADPSARTIPDVRHEIASWLDHAAASVSWIAIVALVVWQSSVPPARFGLVRRPHVLDLLLAALTFGAFFGAWPIVTTVLNWFFDVAHWPGPSSYANATHATTEGQIAFVFAMLANGIAEELVMRCYLLTRLEMVLRSSALAIVGSALVFASYHIYQGPLAALVHVVDGLLFGFAFVWRRSVWPVAIAHAAIDLVLI